MHRRHQGVKSRREKRKQPKKRVLPDALVITAKGQTTYADILRKVKTDPELKQVGDRVTRIRRTQKGDLLLELQKGEKLPLENLQIQVEKSIGEVANIRSRQHETTIQCRDLDEITTREEICQAFAKELGLESVPLATVKTLRKAYDGTQTAVISLPTESANKLIALNKVRIGWAVCRIREKTTLQRCFKCCEFGHWAKSCKGEDRSGRCRRCGEEGHIAKDCGKDPSCMLCKGNKGTSSKHTAGSSACPFFRRALNAANK